MKHQNPSKPLSHCGPPLQRSSLDDFPKSDDSSLERKMYDDHGIPNGLKRKVISAPKLEDELSLP